MNLFLRHMIVAIVLGVSGFATTVFSAETATPEAEPDDDAKIIIAQTAKTYKNCTSYLDSGVVTTTFYMPKSTYTKESPFTTAFMRPGRFRFEYSTKSPSAKANVKQHIIWVNNKEILVWKDAKLGIEKEASLGDAIADAVGKSSGAAQTIPVLIGASAVGGRSLMDLIDPKRINDGTQDGVLCYRVQGKRMPASTSLVTLWISQKTFLIQRIDSSQKFSNFSTATTKIYKPRINIAIDESKLAFNAPGQKQ